MGSPVSQNRQGRSAALLTPTRGPRLTRGDVPAGRRAGWAPRPGRAGPDPQRRAGIAHVRAVLGPVDAEGLAEPRGTAGQIPVSHAATSHGRPGRPARRRAAARPAPSVTRPARSSTAVAIPSGSQTRFTQKCMP